MQSKKALITGITGQDGSYLAELLLGKGYEVHGLIRRSSSFNTGRIDHIYQDPHEPGLRLRLHYGDLNDGSSLNKLIRILEPDEIYNLGAQSHVRVSFDIPEYTGESAGLAAVRLLESIRESGVKDSFSIRRHRVKCSENAGERPQTETTPFAPRSPYAAAKMYAYWMTVNYREAYGIYAVNGILFNHESPRRGETFVSRKISMAAARIKLGVQEKLYLGNLDARRDWGFAGDYVEAMWSMLQQDTPDDYIVATGVSHSVRDFLDVAFAHAGPRLESIRRDRSEVLPSHRSGRLDRERDESPYRARMAAACRLRGAGTDDGRRRLESGEGEARGDAARHDRPVA